LWLTTVESDFVLHPSSEVRGLGVKFVPQTVEDYSIIDPIPDPILWTLTRYLIFWTQNQQASTNCRGLLLCQVSSHCDQGFSFYRANIPTHPHTPR